MEIAAKLAIALFVIELVPKLSAHQTAVIINLREQTAYLLQDGRVFVARSEEAVRLAVALEHPHEGAGVGRRSVVEAQGNLAPPGAVDALAARLRLAASRG